jgi:hypothetical protein
MLSDKCAAWAWCSAAIPGRDYCDSVELREILSQPIQFSAGQGAFD